MLLFAMERFDENIFECKICSKSYQREHQLKMHLYRHDDKAYSCNNCSIKFLTLKGSLDHEKNKICQKILPCVICAKEFKTLSSLNSHKRNHSKSLVYTCDVCGKVFVSQESLDLHQSIHSGTKPVPCNLCPARFLRKQGLKMHENKVHHNIKGILKKCHICGEEVEKLKDHLVKHGFSSFLCLECPREFKRKGSRDFHMKIHRDEKDFSCSFCGKNFRQKPHLKIHIKVIHEGIREFKCSFCEKHFAEKGKQIKHEKIHKDRQQRHPCKICDKSFLAVRSMKKHITEVHISSDFKPFSCTLCDKSFKRKSHLSVHRNLHYSENSFNCTYCGKEFKQKGSCKDHELSHTGGYTSRWEICDKSFSRKITLLKHQFTHQDNRVGRPHKCVRCPDQFRTIEMLDNHNILYHNPEYRFECEKCKHSYETNEKLKIHQKTTHETHEEDRTCPICYKIFKYSRSLSKHKRISQHWTYKCKECKVVYLDENNYQKHILIYYPSLRFPCDICKNRFSKKSALTRHVRTHSKTTQTANNSF